MTYLYCLLKSNRKNLTRRCTRNLLRCASQIPVSSNVDCPLLADSSHSFQRNIYTMNEALLLSLVFDGLGCSQYKMAEFAEKGKAIMQAVNK